MDFQIIKGSPTDEEIAALAVALAKIEGSRLTKTSSSSAESRWGRPKLRKPIRAGINGWRKS